MGIKYAMFPLACLMWERSFFVSLVQIFSPRVQAILVGGCYVNSYSFGVPWEEVRLGAPYSAILATSAYAFFNKTSVGELDGTP